MRFTILALAVLALTGCVSDRAMTNYICAHQISTVAAANFTIANADRISDPVLRSASIAGARLNLALVKACPNSIIPADAETVQVTQEMLSSDPVP